MLLSEICVICLETEQLTSFSRLDENDNSYYDKLKHCIPDYDSEHFDITECYLCHKCAISLTCTYNFYKSVINGKGRIEELIMKNKIRKKRDDDMDDNKNKLKLTNIKKEKDDMIEIQDEYIIENNSVYIKCDDPLNVETEMENESEDVSRDYLDQNNTETGSDQMDYYPSQSNSAIRYPPNNKIGESSASSPFATKLNKEADPQYLTAQIDSESITVKFTPNFAMPQERRSNPFKKEYPCEHCGKVFMQSSNLKSHVKYKHTKERDFMCTVCGKGFVEKGNMHKHIKRYHLDEFQYLCDVCQLPFQTEDEMMEHKAMEKCYIVRKIQCELCQQTFCRKAALDRHMHDRHSIRYLMKVMKNCEKNVQIKS